METGTLKEFITDQPHLIDNGNKFVYSFYYEHVPCFGVVTILPHTEELKIIPCKMSDSIEGNPPGTSITKEFKRDTK
jgi:hypothetical protein